MKRKDLTGKRFGRLTVIEYVGTKYDKNGGNAKAQWKCKCDCGNIRVVNSASLLLGRSKSCGCLCREINSKRMKKMIKENGCYIKRLQEQLADANKTIDYYDKKDFHYTLADGTVMGAEPAHKYFVKWGIPSEKCKEQGDFPSKKCKEIK